LFRQGEDGQVTELSRATVVVVHFGDPEPTVRLANELVGFETGGVVVVANDRSGRPPALDEGAEWIVPDRNLGYGAAFAAAVRDRSTEAFVVLNTDIVLPRATFERCLDALLRDESVGIVGPLLRHADGALQSGAADFSRWRRAPRVLFDPGPATVECAWVTGAVMFVRRAVVERVGVDGSFFLGAEDADLCVRARRAGWRVLCCGDAPAVHHGSRVISGPRWTYYAARNRVWFARAHFGLGPDAAPDSGGRRRQAARADLVAAQSDGAGACLVAQADRGGGPAGRRAVSGSDHAVVTGIPCRSSS
jgi:GT2 family glycosyltransferase